MRACVLCSQQQAKLMVQIEDVYSKCFLPEDASDGQAAVAAPPVAEPPAMSASSQPDMSSVKLAAHRRFWPGHGVPSRRLLSVRVG